MQQQRCPRRHDGEKTYAVGLANTHLIQEIFKHKVIVIVTCSQLHILGSRGGEDILDLLDRPSRCGASHAAACLYFNVRIQCNAMLKELDFTCSCEAAQMLIYQHI